MAACRRETASCAGWMSAPASRPIRTVLPTTTQRLPRSSSQRRTSGLSVEVVFGSLAVVTVVLLFIGRHLHEKNEAFRREQEKSA